MASLGYGLGLGRFLPLTVVFSLFSSFCFSGYIVHLRSTSGGWGVGGKSRERLLPRSVVVTAKWVVSCTRITCIQPLSRCSLTFPASSFFSVSVCLLLLSLFVFSLFSSTIRLSFLSLAYWPIRNRC